MRRASCALVVTLLLVVVGLGFRPARGHALPVCDVSTFRPGARWSGTYTCSQGLTDLTLAIEAVHGLRVDALFDFDWPAGGISGRFEMSGTFETASCRLHLRPVRWISRPDGWEMAGLDGTLDASGARYAGRMSDFESGGCTTFAVTRPRP